MSKRRREFRIFVSYARPNQPAALDLYRKLREAKLDPWLDVESLPPGAEWEPEIEKAIQHSHVVLVLLSKESVTRDGFLQKEILTSLDVLKHKAPGKIFLIPVRIEECSIHERLCRLNWIDLFAEAGWTRLLAHLKQLKRDAHAGRATAPVQQEVSAQSSTSTEVSHAPAPIHLPFLAFPDAVENFLIGSEYERTWLKLDRNVQRCISTIGCKLEPIVQIVPPRGARVLLGFECLALGARGENFGELMRVCRGVDPGVVRICLAVAAIETIKHLRAFAIARNDYGARHLKFSLNLDSVMLDHVLLKRFFLRTRDDWLGNVLYEVNETTTTRYVDQLKTLQSDFDLRYAADDLNLWDPEVRAALMSRIELTKMDHKAFTAAMKMRGDDPAGALKMIRAHKIRGIPLVVEGVESSDFLVFLESKWKYGELYGQGYELNPGNHWEGGMLSLKEFGLPGGSALRRRA